MDATFPAWEHFIAANPRLAAMQRLDPGEDRRIDSRHGLQDGIYAPVTFQDLA